MNFKIEGSEHESALFPHHAIACVVPSAVFCFVSGLWVVCCSSLLVVFRYLFLALVPFNSDKKPALAG